MKNLNLNFILLFLLFLFIYLFPTIMEPFQISYYESLTKPVGMLPVVLFITVQLIILAFLSLSITLTVNSVKFAENKQFPIILIIVNYIFVQLYPILIKYHELLLAFIDAILITLSTLFLYYFGYRVNKKASYFLIPVIIWSVYICFIQMGLFRLN